MQLDDIAARRGFSRLYEHFFYRDFLFINEKRGRNEGVDRSSYVTIRNNFTAWAPTKIQNITKGHSRNKRTKFILADTNGVFLFHVPMGINRFLSEYLKKDLIQFAKEHPHVEVIVTPRPSKHPVIRGLYRTSFPLLPFQLTITEDEHKKQGLALIIPPRLSISIQISQWKGQGCVCTQHGANGYCRQGCVVEGVCRQPDEGVQEARHLDYRVCQGYLVSLPRRPSQDLRCLKKKTWYLSFHFFSFYYFSCYSYFNTFFASLSSFVRHIINWAWHGCYRCVFEGVSLT